jgi:hypothetical protein
MQILLDNTTKVQNWQAIQNYFLLNRFMLIYKYKRVKVVVILFYRFIMPIYICVI